MTRSRWFVISIFLLFAFIGLVEPLFINSGYGYSDIAVVQGLLLAVLLFGWCKAHASGNGISPPAGAPLLVAFLAPIGVPYYAFRGYGFRKGLRLVGLALLALILLMIVYGVSLSVGDSLGA